MMKNMKIAKKLIVAFVTITLIASVAGVVGLVLLTTLDRDYGEALVANGFVQGNIGDYNANLNKGGAIVRDIIMLTDEEDIKASQIELEEVKKLTQEALDAAAEKISSPEERALLEKINAASPKYKEARDRAVALGLQNKNDEAMRVFHEEARPYLVECTTAGQEWMEVNVKLGNEVSDKLTAQAMTGIICMVIIMISATIAAVIVAVLTARGISRPVKACADRLVLLSEGDLHTPVPKVISNDETGIMLHALETTTSFITGLINEIGRVLGEVANGNLNINATADFKGDFNDLKIHMEQIVTSLNDTMMQINQSSEQVSGGADQVSSGAQALSQGTTEQASSIQELAASISEISQQVKSNAENAKVAGTQASEAGDEVTISNEKMQQLIAAMSQISNSSKEIGKVIKTIEDIAFQTNILALNAAVEAARAGAAGKGFAVVADEVRNLATKSSEAAKGTTVLIEGAITAVDNGTKLVDETAKSLLVVVDKTIEVSSTVNKISIASSEQAQSIGQVTVGVDQISSVVQTNSATAEESAAASEELSGQATILKELVGKFNLKKQY